MFLKASLNDAKLIFNLRFEKTARKNSIYQRKISYLDHLKWYRKIINNKKDKILIFQKNKGYLRISNEKNRKFLSWNINKDSRQKGFGYKMLSEYLLSSKDNYFAIIKKSNLASIRLVKKVGFRYIKKIRDGILLYSFTKKN